MSTNKITTLSIEDDAVTQAKILDDAVTQAKIATNAVGTSELLNDAVTIGKIDFGHDDLDGFLTNEHIDWTANQSSSIHFGNLPALALTTVQTATDQAAHLALTTQEGDVVVRSDENKSYIHNAGSTGTMNDFTLLATPTDAVLSVNGQTGIVSIPNATSSQTGLVTSTQIAKLDGIEVSAQVSFPSGTKMIFFQAAAPTGWTQDTANNDKALRVVSGSGGGSGGFTAFSSAFTHTHSDSFASSAHTLTTSEIPAHKHPSGSNSSASFPSGSNVGILLDRTSGFANQTRHTDNSTGGGGSHSHSISGSVTSTTISPKYVDVIVCIKD